MTPKAFARWVKNMKADKGWSQAEVARRLGTTASQIKRWSEYSPPPYIDLAVAALNADLPPYRGGR